MARVNISSGKSVRRHLLVLSRAEEPEWHRQNGHPHSLVYYVVVHDIDTWNAPTA